MSNFEARQRRWRNALGIALTAVVLALGLIRSVALAGASLVLAGVFIQSLLEANNFKPESPEQFGEGTDLSPYELEVLKNMVRRQTSSARDAVSLAAIGAVVAGSGLLVYAGAAD